MSGLLGKLKVLFDLNQSTLSGTIDIIVIELQDGTLVSTPFHVKFGKLQLLQPREKIVSIEVNDELIDVQMKLGDSGEAYFVKLDEDGVILYSDEEGWDSDASPIYQSPVRTPEPELQIQPDPKQWVWWTWKQDNVLPPFASNSVDQEVDQRSRSWISGFLSMFSRRASNGESNAEIPVEQIICVLRPSWQDCDDVVEVDLLITSSGVVELVINEYIESNELSQSDFFNSVNVPEEEDIVRYSAEVKYEAVPLDESKKESDEMRLSLCGSRLTMDPRENIEAFEACLVSHEQLCSNPDLFFNPDLIVSYRGTYYPAQVAVPLIMSYIVFGKPLDDDCLGQLAEESPYKEFNALPNEEETSSRSSGSRFLKWFNRSSKNVDDQFVSAIEEDRDSFIDSSDNEIDEKDIEAVMDEDFKDFSDVESKTSYRKSTRPAHEMLKSFNLKEGKNTISFIVDSNLQGLQRVDAYIYLWPVTAKIVVSDVDGTITRSDLLGQVMPLMGKDWSHKGVTDLFSNIIANGYKIVYLTSRAIGQASVTREYLNSVRQRDIWLPEGPIIMSPDGLMHSFKREVLDRRPQDFKIPALRNLRHLFPDDVNPFVAGFGNRHTDAESYEAVGIPQSKVFIINPKGEIQHYNRTLLTRSYPKLNDLVNEMFPPVEAALDVEYGGFGYWRDPYVSISEEEEL